MTSQIVALKHPGSGILLHPNSDYPCSHLLPRHMTDMDVGNVENARAVIRPNRLEYKEARINILALNGYFKGRLIPLVDVI